MPSIELTRKQDDALRRYEQKYEELKSELVDFGYILQGSVTERWMECGKAACRCHADAHARHGPYYQWSWKSHGRTGSIYLDKDQAALCRQWIDNNRRLERLIKRLRTLSIRVARVYKIAKKRGL